MAVETALQGALYTTLTASSPLMAIVQSVADIQPQGADSGSTAVFPFVTVGDIIITQMDADVNIGYNALCTIHTFSRANGMKECKTIQGLIFSALHRVSLTVSGFTCYSIVREDTRLEFGPDNEFHGICEYRALVE